MKFIYTAPKVFLSSLLIAILVFGVQNDSRADLYEDAIKLYDSGDYVGAAKIIKVLAEQGDASAQYNLGVLYAKGRGVAQDFNEAVKWYRKAAEQGDAFAQGKLGAMYHFGMGVPRDYIQAHKWFNLAASGEKNDRDRELMIEKRDAVEMNMTSSQIAEAQKLAREWKPKN